MILFFLSIPFLFCCDECLGIFKASQESPLTLLEVEQMLFCDAMLTCKCLVPGYIAMYATLASRDVVIFLY